MFRSLALVALLGLVVAGCSDAPKPPAAGTTSTAVSSAPTRASSPTVDPYDVYRKRVPKGEPTLSRSDAATRAQLGCGQKWPAGTTDAVLAEAYAGYCK
jgi:hypothetical protein